MSERIIQQERAKSFGFFLYRDSKGEVSGRGGIRWMSDAFGPSSSIRIGIGQEMRGSMGKLIQQSLSLSRLAVRRGQQERARAHFSIDLRRVCVYGPLIMKKFV